MNFSGTRERTLILYFGLFVVGLILFVIGGQMKNPDQQVQASILNNLGGLVAASIGLALFWDLFQKKTFTKELYDHLKVGEEIRKAGLSTITTDFNNAIPWKVLFDKSSNVRILLAYGRTWFSQHQTYIESFLKKANVRLTVILPDYTDADVVAELCNKFPARYKGNPQKMIDAIKETEDLLRDFETKYPGKVTVKLFSRTLVFSAYQFDAEVVLANFNHRIGKSPVLSFRAESTGDLYDYIKEELDYIETSAENAPYIRTVVP